MLQQDVNGPNRSALYQYLFGNGSDIGWNFGKILVGRNGNVMAREPQVTPENSRPANRYSYDVALADPGASELAGPPAAEVEQAAWTQNEMLR